MVSRLGGVLAAGLLALALLPAPGPAEAGRRALAAAAPQAESRPRDPAKEFEKERQRRAEEIKREKRRQERAARAGRRDALQQLRDDLPRLLDSARALESKLAEMDPERELSVELLEKGQEVERLGRRIHQNIKRL